MFESSLTTDEVKAHVAMYIEHMLEANDYDIEILCIEPSPSGMCALRRFSDLDVVVMYSGDVCRDELSSVMNSCNGGCIIGDVCVNLMFEQR